MFNKKKKSEPIIVKNPYELDTKFWDNKEQFDMMDSIHKLNVLRNSMASNQNFVPYTYDWEQDHDKRLIVFFGFNGMLACKYSIVEMKEDEIVSRLQFAGDKCPYIIKSYDDFGELKKHLEGTKDYPHEIPFDDALNIIRIGIDNSKVVDVFEDAEEDEFDDNCLETCRPGDHHCGK